jgi:hypothetical protein
MELTCGSESARCRGRIGSGLPAPAIELRELLTLPLGVGDCMKPPSRSISPFRLGDFSDPVPSEVWMFLVACGSPVAGG